MSARAENASALGRSSEQAALVVILVLFGALTMVALVADGIAGIVDAITFNWLSIQIFADLVIAVAVIMVWVHHDARARGRNPWPWILAAPFVGMFSPLAYLLLRSRDA